MKRIIPRNDQTWNCLQVVHTVRKTRYGPEGSGIECRFGREFPCLFRPSRGPPSLLEYRYRVFAGVERLGIGANHQSATDAESRSGCSCTFALSLYLQRHVMGWFLYVYSRMATNPK